MTTRTPRQLAEACYAVARSTTHPAERQAAIGRGDAICERYGLDLATFDVPGRARRAQRAGTAERRCRYSETSFRTTSPAGDFLRRAFADFERSLEEARARAGAAEDETPYDARRRNFDRATAAAAERDRARSA